MSKRRFFCGSSVLAASLALALSTSAAAQQPATPQPPAEDEAQTEVDSLVITGSFIRGTPETAAIPVEGVNLEEIRDRGSPSNLDLVKGLSEIGSVAGEANRANGFAIGAQTINLRSLSSSRTVVVFNGRRFPEQYSASVGRFNNIAVIPNAAIGRVEILKDGGATTYGADAVGGVVNYITRPAFDGLEANASYRWIDGSDGDYDLSITAGKKYDDFYLWGVVSYARRNDLPLLERDFAVNPYLTNPSSYSASQNPGSYSFQTASGTITPTGVGINNYSTAGTGRRSISATGALRDPYCAQLGGFSGFSSTPTPVCYSQSGAVQNLVEEQNTYQAYLEAGYTFSDKLKIKGEFLYYGLDIPGIPIDNGGALIGNFPITPGSPTGAIQTAAGSPAYFVPGTNPFVADFLNAFKNQDGTPTFGTGPGSQFEAITTGGRVVLGQSLWRPFGIGGIPGGPIIDEQKNTSSQFRYVLEAKGNLGKFAGIEFDYSTAATYNTLTYKIETRDILVDRLQSALNGFGGPSCTGAVAGANGCQYFNPFSTSIATIRATGQASGIPNVRENSVDLVNWLYVPISLERTAEYFIGDAVLRGSADYHLWSDDNIEFALGAQYRRIHEKNDLSDFADRTVNPCATVGVTNCTTQAGPLAFNRGANLFGFNNDSDRKYPVHSAFAEVKVPVTDTFFIQWASRYEKFFSDIGGVDNDVIVNQGSARWEVTPWLALRGTAGQTFSNVNPPAPNAPSTTSTAAAAAYGGSAISYTSRNVVYADVKPESGLSWNAGAQFTFGDFTGSIDYYNIKIKGIARANTATNFIESIIAPGQSAALLGNRLVNCAAPALTVNQATIGNVPFVQTAVACNQGTTTIAQLLPGSTISFFGPQGQQTALYNGSSIETDGIDLGAKYRIADVWGGDLSLRADSSIALNWEAGEYVVEGIKVGDAFGGTGSLHVATTKTGGQRVANWRWSVGANYRKGRHTFDWQTNMVSSFDDDEVTNYQATAQFNANIGNANGQIPTGACTAPAYDNAVGAGTGQYGQINTCQNVLILAGKKIPESFNTDVTYTFRMTPKTMLNVTVQNLFDADPSFARTILGYDAFSGSPLGRTIRFGIRKTL